MSPLSAWAEWPELRVSGDWGLLSYREAISDLIRSASAGVAGGPFHAIAEVIGRRLNLPAVSKSPEDAAEHFGWFAVFAGIDAPTSSLRTRSLLDWQPEQPGLIADIDHPAYFES